MRASHPASLAAALLLGLAGFTVSGQAAVYKENIDVPLQVVPARKGLFGRFETGYDSAIPSERFYASKEGKARAKKTSGQQADGSYRIITYRVPEVLRQASARNTEVVIDIGSQRAFLLVNGRIGLETPVSTARSGKYTPTGTFAMTERVRTGKVSNLYDVEMPYWMRLNTSEFGVHAGYLPGYPASAGCIRLPQDAAQLIFDRTRPGTRVRILHNWRPSVLAQPGGSSPTPASPRPAGRGQTPAPVALPVDRLGQTFGRIEI